MFLWMPWIRYGPKEENNINKRSVGNEYEERAVDYLVKSGVKILKRNFRSRFGEIDIIGRDKEYLVFYEVKYKKSTLKGYPEEAVNINKMKKICKVSDYYRLINGIGEDSFIRFDVLSLTDNDCKHIKNAFSYVK